MARVIVNNTSFTPFTFDEMLKPLAIYGLEYRALEEALGELDTKASIWEGIANEQTDPYAYKVYKSYANDLERLAGELASKGLSLTSRKLMLDMKSRYSKEIVPIETAYKRREELATEQRKALAANPTLRYQRMANAMSLDDFLKNPSLDYGESYSGALLTLQVSLAAANFQRTLTDKGKLKGLGLPYQYERMLQYGATPEQVMAAMSKDAQQGDSEAVKFLRGITEQVLKSSGVANWADDDTMKEFRAFANQGLYSAIGQTKIDNFTDQFSMQDALNARQHERQLAAAKAAAAANDRAAKGNLPIDIHHLVSPNQLGEQGALMVESLRAKLGLAKTYDGKTAKWAKTVDLGNLVVGKSDMFTYTFKNSSGGTTVRLFNLKGELLNRNSVVNQGGSDASKEALGRWYDSMYLTLTTNFMANKNGRWTTNSILSQMNDINSGKGAITMGAMRINFGADNNKKALEALLPGMTTDDKTQIYEITSFDKKGSITTGKRASSKDFIDDKGNAISTPMFYAAPNANTDGLIMKFNGKTYLIPRNKLGSLGEQVYNINIPELLKANELKQSLIDKYGSDAYYGSEEGAAVEQIIDNYGAAYLRAASTALGYSLELPRFGIKANNQTEI